MRRSVTYVAAWAGVTALAVTLSWLGVRYVLRATVFDQPGAVPAVGPVLHGSPRPAPPSPTLPTPADSPRRSPSASRSAPTASPRSSAPASNRPTTSKPSAPSNVHSYSSIGGRAAFAFSSNSARLVSATPNEGYSVNVTRQEYWLRVDFTNGQRTSSIIASWYEHAPKVDVYEYDS